MSYTTVSAVCGMFPMFQRNSAKGPSDTLIQTYVDDVAANIDAILTRRFQEAYQSLGFTAWQAQFSVSQLNLLECINRFGACAELGIVFETAGISAAARVAKTFEGKYEDELNKLNARDKNGKLVEQGGDYDVVFDPQAKVETPRPQLSGVAGGDQQPGQSGSEGSSNVFKKWDRREF